MDSRPQDSVPDPGSLSNMCDQVFEAVCNFLRRAADFTLLAIVRDLEESSHHGLLVARSLSMRPREAGLARTRLCVAIRSIGVVRNGKNAIAAASGVSGRPPQSRSKLAKQRREVCLSAADVGRPEPWSSP